MLTELLHDKYEDLTVDALGQDRFALAESKFRSLLKDIDQPMNGISWSASTIWR